MLALSVLLWLQFQNLLVTQPLWVATDRRREKCPVRMTDQGLSAWLRGSALHIPKHCRALPFCQTNAAKWQNLRE
jgi:hypothetical protein